MNDTLGDLDSPEEERPWEEPGAVRRDCAPHRGPLLQTLGTVSVVCGFLSWCLFFPGLVGLPLGAGVSVLAWRDLKGMEAGLTDPTGRAQVEQARDLGVCGALLSIFGWAISLLFGWAIILGLW